MTLPGRRSRRNELARNAERVRSSGRVAALSPSPEELPAHVVAPAAERELQALRRLQEAIHFLGQAATLSALAEAAVDLGCSLSGLPRGLLALASSGAEGGGKLAVRATRGHTAGRGRPELKVLRGVVRHVIAAREPLLEGSLGRSELLAHAARLPGLRLGAVACLPLEHEGEVLGALLLDDPARSLPFTAPERDLLCSLARHLGQAVWRLARERRLRRRVARLTRQAERLAGERDRLTARGGEGAPPPHPLEELLEDTYRDAVVEFERCYLERALRRAGGDVGTAAELTGLPLAALLARCERLGIEHGQAPHSIATAAPPAPDADWGRAARR